MASKKFLTAVAWSWRGDQNNWLAFDDATNTLLETEYLKGTKKIKVDKERFVDLTGKHSEILKNFNKLDDEEHVVGMQRRYDDENKRRAIRRVAPEFFDGDTFLILGIKGKDKTELTTTIETYGGLVGAKFTKKTTIVICPEADAANLAADLKQASDAGIPVVSPDFIENCVKQKKKAATKDYAVEVKASPPAAAAPAPAAGKKRKADADEDQKDVKASKIDAAPSASSSVIPVPDSGAQSFSDVPALKANTQWMGTSTAEADGSTYPMIMHVKERSQNTFTGEIQWPTLNSARTKFKGQIKGGEVTFEEYEVVTGEDDVEIPMKYVAKANNTEITGKNEHDDPECASTFTLKKIAATASKDFDGVKASTKFKGVCYQPYEFVLEITKRKGTEVEAEMTWPALNNAKTKVRGTIEGDEFSFEEYETTSKDVQIPSNYVGKLSNKKIVGKFRVADTDGVFEMSQ
eukprot:TRINITY_DN3748_c0_g1_i1.p1 TRINITY_DN3748_c0_g1~~TRINITY_DN3748_c0_g1_i1.p1  ORF type:complete len:463 (-),score=163.77 TRINITY_DN3748_c0_g1_i1:44-1432(-)